MPAQMQMSSRIILTPRTTTDNLHGLPEVGLVIHCLYRLQRCLFNTTDHFNAHSVRYEADVERLMLNWGKRLFDLGDCTASV